MLTLSTERAVKNIFIVCCHIKFLNESIKILYYRRVILIKFGFSHFQYMVCYDLFSTTSSIRPKDLAVSAVIKLSLSKADLISSTDLFVCLE